MVFNSFKLHRCIKKNVYISILYLLFFERCKENFLFFILVLMMTFLDQIF